MDKKIEFQILREFSEFIQSEEGKSIAKQKNTLGGRLRGCIMQYKKDTLRPKTALSILLDCKMVEGIIFKSFKKSVEISTR